MKTKIKKVFDKTPAIFKLLSVGILLSSFISSNFEITSIFSVILVMVAFVKLLLSNKSLYLKILTFLLGVSMIYNLYYVNTEIQVSFYFLTAMFVHYTIMSKEKI